jgi:hypothetical protein
MMQRQLPPIDADANAACQTQMAGMAKNKRQPARVVAEPVSNTGRLRVGVVVGVLCYCCVLK